MMLNCRNPLTVQDGRKVTTQISSLHLEASRTCVRRQSDPIPHTQHRPVCVLTVMVPQTWFHRSQPSGSNDLSLQVPTISAYRFQRSQPTGSNNLCLHEVELSGNNSKSRSTPILTVRCSFQRVFCLGSVQSG